MGDILSKALSLKFLLVWFVVSFVYIKVKFWFNPSDSFLGNFMLGDSVNSMEDTDITLIRKGAGDENFWYYVIGFIGLAIQVFAIGAFLYTIMLG